MPPQSTPVTVSVRNLGGIESEQLSVEPGVTVLTGRNATNRTSLLRSIAAALGGSDGELKADADAGSVDLSFDGRRATRQFERRDGSVVASGDPYADDETLVDLFCSLLEGNPARRAVERGDPDALREVVMAPVDTEEIRATVERHRREIDALEDDLAAAERERDRLPALERRRSERSDELASVEEELEAVRESVASFEADMDDAEAAESVVEELTETREEYETVRDRLETQRSALDSLREERESVAAERDAIDAPGADLDDAKDELERLQRRERDLENTINSLLSIVEFNEELLDDEAVPSAGDGGDVVGELDPTSQTVECWTCGTEVDRGAIEGRLGDLRDVIDEKRRERNELRSAIDDQRSAVRDLRETARERRELEATLDDLDAEIEDRESRIEDLERRAGRLEDRIEELEAEAAESDRLRDEALLERYQRISELEYERGQLEEQLASLDEEIEAAEAAADRVETLEAELESHREDLAAARERIETLEREAVETFNEHMATLLDVLGYENVERVWIERKTAADAGEALVPDSAFDLHVVRSADDGAVYEDTVDHLSESEREVIGLVVALAGYLVHDVHETVPFVLLDSLEAIDADRIAALVEYFAEFASYLIVALLPEDAQALPEKYERVPMDGAVA